MSSDIFLCSSVFASALASWQDADEDEHELRSDQDGEGLGHGDAAGGGDGVPVEDAQALRAEANLQEDGPWNTYLQGVVREIRFGFFRFGMKRCSPQVQHGAIEALCPYHARNAITKCKKAVVVRERSPAHVQQIICALQHWCNRARAETHQRGHKWPLHLDLYGTPPAAVIRENLFNEDPPDPLLTDEDLDARARAAAAAAAADAPVAVAKAKGKAHARAKPPARGLGKAKAKGKAQPKERAVQARAAAQPDRADGPAVATSSSSSSTSSQSESSSSSSSSSD